MKLRKGSVADVLWFIALVTIAVILMRSQLEFSSTATIDTYAKNIVNAEVTRFVNGISGFSMDSSNCNMYKSNGIRRDYGNSSSNDETSWGIFNKFKDEMIDSVAKEFNDNNTLNTRTLPINSSNFDVRVKRNTDKSEVLTVTLNYTVTTNMYMGTTGGFVKRERIEIPRKVIVTRVIENPLRFK